MWDWYFKVLPLALFKDIFNFLVVNFYLRPKKKEFASYFRYTIKSLHTCLDTLCESKEILQGKIGLQIFW